MRLMCLSPSIFLCNILDRLSYTGAVAMFSRMFNCEVAIWFIMHGSMVLSKATNDPPFVNTCKAYLNPNLSGGSYFATGPAPSAPPGQLSDGTSQPLNLIISAQSGWPYQSAQRGNLEDFLVEYFSALGLTSDCYTDNRRDQFKLTTANVGDGRGSHPPDFVFREKQPSEPRDGTCDVETKTGLKVKVWKQGQSSTAGCKESAYFINAAYYSGEGVFQGYTAGQQELVRRMKQGGKDWTNNVWPPFTREEMTFPAGVGQVTIVTIHGSEVDAAE